ncbi:FAD-dependent oxidoreductase [Acerihabitans sp. KWT182]|uniref:FAD-dependent oxidoreductase n=1 Tax=Acerihabitans sp. KWT182 TaxID=3157919 RepID=A0AAU7Q631_9GAMM
MPGEIIVVGGGFFGLYLAEYLSIKGYHVTVYEQSANVMMRASYNNQARVHNGYHYPRSILTALRSRVSFPRFIREFKDCVISDFDKYYMVSKVISKVTGDQFFHFCERIGANCCLAPENIRKMVNPNYIESIFSVVEYAFDSLKLREIMIGRLVSQNVKICKNSTVTKVQSYQDGILATITCGNGEYQAFSKHVFNCTYAHTNYLLKNSSLPLIPLKHEMTEICLVDVPDELKHLGITVMCGPFFSVMPFPSEHLHSFSHVRYTPHFEWMDDDNKNYTDSYVKYADLQRNTAWKYMIRDAQRYIPILQECQYRKSLWEVKTVLPLSDRDDSRPILFKPNFVMNGLHCIMGGED